MILTCSLFLSETFARVWVFLKCPFSRKIYSTALKITYRKICSVSSCHGPFSPAECLSITHTWKARPSQRLCCPFWMDTFRKPYFQDTDFFVCMLMAPFATPIGSVKKSAVVRHERSQRNRKLYGSKPYCPTQNNLYKYILQKLSTSIAFNVAAYTHHCHHGALPAWLSKFGQK